MAGHATTCEKTRYTEKGNKNLVQYLPFINTIKTSRLNYPSHVNIFTDSWRLSETKSDRMSYQHI